MAPNLLTLLENDKVPFLIDTHCHLDFEEFSEDLEDLLARALANNVRRMISISTFVKKWPFLLRLTQNYPEIYASIGTHPMNAAAESHIKAQDILALLSYEKLVAIGECGLDYYYADNPAPAVQKQVFCEHIVAAQEAQLPLIIHARNADEDMAQMLKTHYREKAFFFILHCYSSGEILARTALDLGGYISFSGILTFKNAKNVQEIARFVPLDKLLIETDAPYLAPIPYRGKRNEPSFVKEVASYLAQLKAVTFEALARQTSENALKLFTKLR